MKHRVLIAVIIIFAGFFPAGVFAETIHSYDVDVVVAGSGTLTITENIGYDFEDAVRHGIFRNIPYAYTRKGLRYNARVTVQNVQRGGIEEPYDQSRSGGDVVLKIGNPDYTVSGPQEYRIRYTVQRAINWFDGEPELYWNAVGTEWDVPVEHATATVSGIGGYDNARASCNTGTFGSTATNCSIEASADGSSMIIETSKELFASEGFTFAIRYPAGSVQEPTRWSSIRDFLLDNWGFALPVFTFLLLLWLYRRFGKDPAGRGTIIAEYEPPEGMTPTMLGYLKDETIDQQDIAAGIIGLAVKGALKIEYEDRKGLLKFGHTYRLTKRGEWKSVFTEFERELHSALFEDGDSVLLEDLKKTFPKKVGKLKETLHREADAHGYFAHNPNKIRGTYYGIGIALGFLALGPISLNPGLMVGFLVSGGLFLAFAGAMPQKTEKGVLAREHILGFKEFLTVTEKDRLKFHNAPAVRPEKFMEFLPYAMALSVEKEWAGQFKDLTIEQPDWYGGQNWSTFNAFVFASAMSDFGNTAKAQAFTAPNSGAGGGSSGFGGGGFSGGGFGGGGGGSW